MALTEKQKQHASDISAETHIMRTLGTTRLEARRRLHEEARNMREETRKQQAQAADRPAPTPPKIESDTTAFQPRPLTLGINPAPQNNGGGGASPDAAGTKELIVVDNGTAYYYDFKADFVSAV